MNHKKRFVQLGFVLAIPFVIAACGDSDNNSLIDAPTLPSPDMSMPVQLTVTLINATANQPLSPPAVLLHGMDYMPWQVGAPATSGLEELAESGMTTNFVMELGDDLLDEGAEPGLIMPGEQASFNLSADYLDGMSISVATMLVNTNDAFTGVAALDVSSIEIGDSHELLAPVYDAGTEVNSELASTIPGPAGGGEGYNAARDDVGFVAMHGGVVTMDDGLMDSALDESHRFDNGALLIRVSRVQ